MGAALLLLSIRYVWSEGWVPLRQPMLSEVLVTLTKQSETIGPRVSPRRRLMPASHRRNPSHVPPSKRSQIYKRRPSAQGNGSPRLVHNHSPAQPLPLNSRTTCLRRLLALTSRPTAARAPTPPAAAPSPPRANRCSSSSLVTHAGCD
ncbi:hypothetical protein C8Q72DRAFT_387173 [Fomitopsis betulina]|nr:hypothetical protein C8Q72DRAFT_387173 [Fomitopsis betulina]